jgi:hypothetical protein
MNTLEERDNNLGCVHYEPLLKAIFEIVKRSPAVFDAATGGLTISVDEIARAAVTKVGASSSPPPFENTFGTRVSSVNFEDVGARDQFAADIERVVDQLRVHLDAALKDKQPGISLTQYAAGLLTEARSLQGVTVSGSGLRYPFASQDLQEKRLHLRTRAGGEQPWLKGHKLTISVGNISGFDVQLINGICNHIEDTCPDCDEGELEHIRAILERSAQESASELSLLKRVVSKESLGRLQKEAKLRYLEYLSDGIKQGKGRDEEGFSLSQNMVGRLRSLEKYINNSAYPDDHFAVNYGGVTVNYRDLFARADAFDTLPVISDIEGTLGETYDKDRGEQVFTCGIKLKLNGAVQTYNVDNAFDYYLMLLDPESEEHKKRLNSPSPVNQRFVEKVLRILLLYYFVFYKLEDKQFNPIDSIEKRALKILSGDGNESQKVVLLKGLKKTLGEQPVKRMVNGLRDALKKYITNATTGPEKREYQVHLSLGRGILEQDPSSLVLEKKFFRDVLNERGLEALKYLTIEEADAGGNAFCTLPVTFVLEPLSYFPAQEAQRTFKMEYDIQGYHVLPVLLIPNDAESRAVGERFYQNHRRVVMRYQSGIPHAPNSRQAFIYRFSYSLVAYICLKLLLDSARQDDQEQKQRYFVPLVLLHVHQEAEEGDFSDEGSSIHSLSKVLSHMLAGEYLSNSQGFYIEDLVEVARNPQSSVRFKLANGLSSLYSVLPKRFQLDVPAMISTPDAGGASGGEPGIEKLAIIIVSSRKSDANVQVPSYIANVFGEVIGLERIAQQTVRLELLSTFSSNQESERMYQVPTAISDEVERCYKQGYRHFLYIARAPYSSMLHITRPDADEEMFFMSKDIIQALMAGRSDCRIYPLYCDKYYVVNLRRGQKTPALYVDDTRELTSLVTDPRQSSVVFFNLFNGLTVNRQAVYNGVVSYATLINVYDDVIYDQYIRSNLLDGGQPGSLKREILDFLTLLHFSRYEKNEKAITFKLEPYQSIIGTESVGSLALFTHSIGYVSFNVLAFLTEVRGVLNKQGVVAGRL